MGITAYVYRHPSEIDCTLNGWSQRFDRVCVVNAEGPSEPSEDCPAVILERHRTLKNAIHAVSVEDKESGKWLMAGGNFLFSCDSRFSEAVARILGNDLFRFHGAVSIHDRIER